MPRQARLDAPGTLHHVMIRGIERGTIFRNDEDIDKMHTYREAIRNVIGAYILYPGERAIVYPDHDAQYMHEGVGALPLRPDIGAKPVQEHIKNVVLVINDFFKDQMPAVSGAY